MKKYLLITGASRGIGLATAKFFADHGYHILNISRQPCPLEQSRNLSVDFSQAQWEDNLSSWLNQELPDLAQITLIHNAGLTALGTVPQMDIKILRKLLEVNVIAPAILNRLVISKMKPGSSILYVGSTLSEKAVPNSAAYTTSKHAVVGLMRATCQDLFATSIHTACICPGMTKTQMLLKDVFGGNEQMMEEAAKQIISFGRLIDPTEIAKLLYFCAENPVINGAVLHANLGQLDS